VDRAQKEKVVDELGQIFESSGVVVVAHYAGLTVAEMQTLRARARDADCGVRVAKNRLAKIALEGKPCAGIADFLTGMTVLTYSEDPVAAAKVAEDFAKRIQSSIFSVVQWVKTVWTGPVLRPCRACHRARSLLLRSLAVSSHLHRILPGPLAHLLRTSQASFRPWKKRPKLLKQLLICVGILPARWNTT
jgi:hypothetical protein